VTLPAHLGYVALILLVGGESLGLLVPGETALLAAAILARDGVLQIWLVIPLASLAAVIGDNVGYLIGRRGGSLLLTARGPLRAWRLRVLEEGQRFFVRHGGQAVFLGRWVPVARVTVAWLAGTSRMPWRAFLRWNALGGMAWATSVGLAGYVLGTAAEALVAPIGLVAVIAVAILALAAASRSRRGHRDASGA
jgi:membrane-associated protein